MGAHTRQRNLHTQPLPAAPQDGRIPLSMSDLDANVCRSVGALLDVLASVHSERLAALKAVRLAFSEARDLACALVECEGYPALAVSRVDGIGGTLTLGCAYNRDRGEWWVVARKADGGPAWIGPAREPIATARMVVNEMRGR
jgi:hypothetical protein